MSNVYHSSNFEEGKDDLSNNYGILTPIDDRSPCVSDVQFMSVFNPNDVGPQAYLNFEELKQNINQRAPRSSGIAPEVVSQYVPQQISSQTQVPAN